MAETWIPPIRFVDGVKLGIDSINRLLYPFALPAFFGGVGAIVQFVGKLTGTAEPISVQMWTQLFDSEMPEYILQVNSTVTAMSIIVGLFSFLTAVKWGKTGDLRIDVWERLKPQLVWSYVAIIPVAYWLYGIPVTVETAVVVVATVILLFLFAGAAGWTMLFIPKQSDITLREQLARRSLTTVIYFAITTAITGLIVAVQWYLSSLVY